MRVCLNCGRDLPDDARFCDICGYAEPAAQARYTPLWSRTSIEAPGRQGAEQWNILPVSLLLLLIGAAIGVGAGWAIFSSSNPQTVTTQTLTVTSVVTSMQQITVTQSLLATVTQTTSITQTTSNIQTSTTPSNWQEIKRFSGSSDMTTQPFQVSSDSWRIRWSYSTSQNSVFSFKVYKLADPVNPVESVDTSGPSGSGTRNVTGGPATFYLKILAASIDYVIIIEVPS